MSFAGFGLKQGRSSPVTDSFAVPEMSSVDVFARPGQVICSRGSWCSRKLFERRAGGRFCVLGIGFIPFSAKKKTLQYPFQALRCQDPSTTSIAVVQQGEENPPDGILLPHTHDRRSSEPNTRKAKNAR